MLRILASWAFVKWSEAEKVAKKVWKLGTCKSLPYFLKIKKISELSKHDKFMRYEGCTKRKFLKKWVPVNRNKSTFMNIWFSSCGAQIEKVCQFDNGRKIPFVWQMWKLESNQENFVNYLFLKSKSCSKNIVKNNWILQYHGKKFGKISKIQGRNWGEKCWGDVTNSVKIEPKLGPIWVKIRN